MIFIKKYKKILLCIAIGIFFCASFYMIWDINHRFPNAKVEEYVLNQSMKWKDLDFTPISRKIYSAEEYAVAYPEDSYDFDMEKGFLHVVFTIKISNNTSNDIKLKDLMLMQVETSPFEFGNGISMVGNMVGVIKSGSQGTVIELSTVISNSLVSENYWSKEKLESCAFHLVFTYYPAKKILNFG
ncbi:hypothetical protein [[Clostridium] fimetarium]|uniref:DUF4352 domain-containing protein n=1 Tax=[Clostridium] fimetarium TaxID=99656 RepID=A0A1I0RPC2_9FIRM|nr:hypothetical protein [[Clostridium] fimetarium]SEW43039.1 hypothetical protein SAMN05421659_12019 [[Clostridium] fimetarium]